MFENKICGLNLFSILCIILCIKCEWKFFRGCIIFNLIEETMRLEVGKWSVFIALLLCRQQSGFRRLFANASAYRDDINKKFNKEP